MFTKVIKNIKAKNNNHKQEINFILLFNKLLSSTNKFS